jgi:para-aminobenzoate synthetase component I
MGQLQSFFFFPDSSGLPRPTGEEFCLWLPSRGLLALGRSTEIRISAGGDLSALDAMGKDDWWFGYVAFEAKDMTEPVRTDLPAAIGNDAFRLIQPEIVAEKLSDGSYEVHTSLDKTVATERLNRVFAGKNLPENKPVRLEPMVSRETYIRNAHRFLHHTRSGDIYEVNYCVEFRGRARLVSPMALFNDIHARTEAPRAAYLRMGDLHVMCGSPELFLEKNGPTVRSSPIKGTRPVSPDPVEDARFASELAGDKKERSENVMIVDLVRNDLSKSALPGTVRVEELFGIHRFKTVHQMISTIACEVSPEVGFRQLLSDAFPPGSMTGAPKVRALQLINELEHAQRGIYSGSIGYIRPGGDFSFNVVIRSVVYDASCESVSLWVGSALTAECSPETEYDECLLKARALLQSLRHHEHSPQDTPASV